MFGYEYPDERTSGRMNEVAQRELAAARRRGAPGATVWRTRDRAEARWFVVVCDDGCDLRHRVRWDALGGVPYAITEEMRNALVTRHVTLSATSGGSERGHYEQGAEFMPDGSLRPRGQ